MRRQPLNQTPAELAAANAARLQGLSHAAGSAPKNGNALAAFGTNMHDNPTPPASSPPAPPVTLDFRAVECSGRKTLHFQYVAHGDIPQMLHEVAAPLSPECSRDPLARPS